MPSDRALLIAERLLCGIEADDPHDHKVTAFANALDAFAAERRPRGLTSGMRSRIALEAAVETIVDTARVRFGPDHKDHFTMSGFCDALERAIARTAPKERP